MSVLAFASAVFAGLVAGPVLSHHVVELEILDEGTLSARIDQASGLEKAELLIALSAVVDEQDVPRSLDLLQRAETLLRSAGPTPLMAYLYAQRCWAQQLVGPIEEAVVWCNDAVELAQEMGDRGAMVRALNMRGVLHYLSGELSQALVLARNASNLAASLPLTVELGRAYNLQGRAFLASGLYGEAVERFQDALKFVDQDHAPNIHPVIYFNLGEAHLLMGQYQLARDYVEGFLVHSRERQLYRKQFDAILMLARVDLAMDDTDAVIRRVRDALARPELQVGEVQKALGHALLARTYLQQGDLPQAREAFARALQAKEVVGDNFELRVLELDSIRLLRASGDVDGAQRELDGFIQRIRGERAYELLRTALLERVALKESIGAHAEALDGWREADELSRRLSARQLSEQLALIRAQYDADRQQIEFLQNERDRVRWIASGAVLLALLLGVSLVILRVRQRRKEAERIRYSAELERKVDERTLELRAEMERRAQADSARLSLERRLAEDDKLRVIGQLTGGVAHDFNDLLTVILGSVELMRYHEEQLTPELRSLVDHVTTAASSGARITRALMSYARRQPMKPERIPLVEFLREHVPMIAHALGPEVSLELKVDGVEDVEVLLDEGHLLTALLNLALNASDAQGGQGSIHVDVHRKDLKFVVISVHDYGIGMSEEDVKRACEPFFTTKKEGEGAGLGLSMVYGFAKQIGGDLQLVSQVGEGTTVGLFLPVQEPQQETFETEREASA